MEGFCKVLEFLSEPRYGSLVSLVLSMSVFSSLAYIKICTENFGHKTRMRAVYKYFLCASMHGRIMSAHFFAQLAVGLKPQTTATKRGLRKTCGVVWAVYPPQPLHNMLVKRTNHTSENRSQQHHAIYSSKVTCVTTISCEPSCIELSGKAQQSAQVVFVLVKQAADAALFWHFEALLRMR